jgi:metal-dependent hydrolase (beta-lactamase superfamily II)
VLVDAGLSCRELMKRMAAAGQDPAELDAILITHEHLDHVAGLTVLARKLKIPVFFTEATHRAWVRMVTPQKRMTYAAWLEKMQREREAAATVEAGGTTEQTAAAGRCGFAGTARGDEARSGGAASGGVFRGGAELPDRLPGRRSLYDSA